MTTKRKAYAASFSQSEPVRRRSTMRAKRKSPPPSQSYGPIFFVIMGITIAAALGFLGVVASVLAGS